jgi:DNA-directed RNA polymerase specialized sigma24 family protein
VGIGRETYETFGERETTMRPHAQPADNNRPTDCQRTKNYELITQRYLHYILIRCTAYTNDRTVAQRIAAYTLITTCLISDRLRKMSDLGLVVETMIEMVGQDQTDSEKGIVNSEKPDVEDGQGGTAASEAYGLRPEACDADDGPAVFLLSAPLCEVAGAINGLERFERQLLVLHHVEGIACAELAKLNAVSQKRIEKTLAKAEREFVELLRGMSSWDHVIDPDVHSLLNDLVACLDSDWSQALATFALRYVSEAIRH